MRWTTNPLLRGPKKPNWLDLPHDLTFKIFSKLGTFHILTSAQQVCRQWRSICMDPLMWRTINMCNNIGIKHLGDFGLEKTCMNAIDRSCGLLEDLSIKFFGSTDLFKYIIDSQCQLRRLRLVLCFDISEEGLIEIAERLPMLEELDISLCRKVSSVALEAIGRGCPLLKSFKFNDNYSYHIGVSAILNGCPHLESLDLSGCRNVKLKGKLRRRCDEQLKDFMEPDTSHAFRAFYDSEYEDLAFEYRSKKKMFREFANNKTTQGDGELSNNLPGVQFEKEEEGVAATANCGEIYGIWECVKNQRSRKAFKRYLTQKEKKKENHKSKGKKNHGRKERQLIWTKEYVSCFEMEDTE
ncbi:hypothetical protein PIB30_070382 [Stylosanthes scabra]|uniref:F-box domain-containing protein n=1 Tax=Stylosanthes scabra TaxID=79078 RepID=A0ABU6WP57_9FABA|nr:hypothetical protein [Stylosanthes scabra]